MSGTDWRSWSEADARADLRPPVPGDDKYTRGVVGIMTGSAMYPGAAVLGVEAAARAGAGMVRYLGPERAADLVLQRRPEAVTADGRVQAWVLGSGMDAKSRSDEATEGLLRALGQGVPTVIDAGALDLVGRVGGPAVITPHYRELATVLTAAGEDVTAEDVAADAAGWAERAAATLGVTVLLKGHTTYVVGPETRIRVLAGPAWLATAGSGDVLAGILGAMVAAAADRISADPAALARVSASAALVHGRAGALASAGGPLVALDIAEAAPAVIATLLASG
ncbi:ADP-dependent NAD(P)H-hydrate dehydratase [Planctomonas deserti]|uniref:ADP-dependent NAD(P)H-hydrate dehydratase n=1 Tax=Planctomonas deserti TaxID=2144185 RepID=UPI003F6805A0